MKTTDVYGVAADSLLVSQAETDAVVERSVGLIRAVLGIEFQGWTGDSWNGTYYRHSSSEFGDIMVVNNGRTDDPDDMPYLEYPSYGVVIEIHAPAVPDDVHSRLTAAGFVHIRRTSAP